MVKVNPVWESAQKRAAAQKKNILELKEIINYERNISKFRVRFGYDLKGEIEDECENREEKRKIREKYKKIINSVIKIKGWVYRDIRTTKLDEFKKLYTKKYGYCSSYDCRCAHTTRTFYKIHRQKNRLKQVKKSFKNNDFIAYTNQYVQHKISEKDKEIKRLKKELKEKKEKEKKIEHCVSNMGRSYQLSTFKTGSLASAFNSLKSIVNKD